MKHYPSNLKIELSYSQLTGNYRYYYWRIKPSELSFWNRLFNNAWHQLFHACGDDWNPCFSPKRYWDDIDNLKTVEDIEKYIEREWNKIQIERNILIENKLKFPYE